MDGGAGRESNYHAHFKGSKRYTAGFWKRNMSNNAWLISTALNIVFELDWQKSEVSSLKRKNTRLFWEKFTVLDCSSLRFFRIITLLKHNSSYRGFKVPRVKLQ